MKRSAKWAVVRKEAPKMPWEGDPTAAIFPRLAERLGTSFALRHWNLFEQYVGILDEYPDDEDAEFHIREFLENVAVEQGEAGYAEFLLVLKHVRLVGGGMARRRVARTALKKQLARVRRA